MSEATTSLAAEASKKGKRPPPPQAKGGTPEAKKGNGAAPSPPKAHPQATPEPKPAASPSQPQAAPKPKPAASPKQPQAATPKPKKQKPKPEETETKLKAAGAGARAIIVQDIEDQLAESWPMLEKMVVNSAGEKPVTITFTVKIGSGDETELEAEISAKLSGASVPIKHRARLSKSSQLELFNA